MYINPRAEVVALDFPMLGDKTALSVHWRAAAERVRRNAGSYKLNYDLHRAGSLWPWLLLLILAFTAFSLNLYREVFYPVMSSFSQVTPTPFDTRTPTGPLRPIEPRVGFAEIIEQASAEGARRNWKERAAMVPFRTKKRDTGRSASSRSRGWRKTLRCAGCCCNPRR